MLAITFVVITLGAVLAAVVGTICADVVARKLDRREGL
jgi:hypothetical protein